MLPSCPISTSGYRFGLIGQGSGRNSASIPKCNCAYRYLVFAWLPARYRSLVDECWQNNIGASSAIALRPHHFGISSAALPSLADGSPEAGQAGALDEDALLARPLALLLHPPIGVVANAAGLADDQVGG